MSVMHVKDLIVIDDALGALTPRIEVSIFFQSWTTLDCLIASDSYGV